MPGKLRFIETAYASAIDGSCFTLLNVSVCSYGKYSSSAGSTSLGASCGQGNSSLHAKQKAHADSLLRSLAKPHLIWKLPPCGSVTCM